MTVKKIKYLLNKDIGLAGKFLALPFPNPKNNNPVFTRLTSRLSPLFAQQLSKKSLTPGIKEALEKAAQKDRRSMSSFLEKLIIEYLEKEGIPYSLFRNSWMRVFTGRRESYCVR